MDKYVSKEIAIKRIKHVKPHVVMSEYGVGYERGLKDAIGILNATPSADVQPVKRGRWENTNTPNQLRCSKCEVIHFIAQYPHGEINFCPNCGARMDLKDGDEE